MLDFPRTAYVSLWYPKPSETFIFYETLNMWRWGVPLSVHSLYAALAKNLATEMRDLPIPVERLGCCALPGLTVNLGKKLLHGGGFFNKIMAPVIFRKWSCLEQMGENLWAFLCAPTLADHFVREGVRHIHAAWANGPATAAWAVSMMTGIPFSFSARAGDICPPDGALREKFEAAAFVRVDSAHNIPYLSGLYPEFAGKIHLVRNPSSWSSCGKAAATMGSPLRILALARFVKTKGLEYLVRAAKRLDEAGVDFRLTLGGSGMLELSLKTLAATLGIKDKVFFPGFIDHDQVPAHMLKTDVFVMPSVVKENGDRDGLPTVLMEALLHGVPVIATDVGGICEVVEDGVTGLIVPQRDPDALAGAILRLKADPEAARAMAEAGTARVRDLYDTERNVGRMMDLIRENAG